MQVLRLCHTEKENHCFAFFLFTERSSNNIVFVIRRLTILSRLVAARSCKSAAMRVPIYFLGKSRMGSTAKRWRLALRMEAEND